MSPVIECPNCGERNREGAQFCNRCGRPIATLSPKLICAGCDAPNPADGRFCNTCGRPLVIAGREVVCPFCREPNREGARFCKGCGRRLPAVAATGEGAPAAGRAEPTTPARLIRANATPVTAPLVEETTPAAASGRNGPRLLWWYIPAGSVLHSSSFRALVTMRISTETALNALSYGMLLAIATNTENKQLIGILTALVTVATVAPAALFGPLGGVVVDRVPKRLALVITNLVRAILCFAFLFIGTSTPAVYLLLVILTVVTQFATPAESAIVPRVVQSERLAAANSFSNLAESAGALLGTAVLAPLIVSLTHGTRPLILICGVVLTYAAVRAVAIRLVVPEAPVGPRGGTEKKPWLAGTREALLEAWHWLAGDRAAFVSMMLLVLASTANLVMVTLAPRFAQQALDLPPQLAIYVFGPAVLGVLTGLALTPKLAEHINKRLLVTIGFLLMVSVLLFLGLIDGVRDVLQRLGPLGWLLQHGPLANRDGLLGTALILAAPLGFGMSMVQVAAQTLLHERVPLEMQGRVFALQGAVKNAVAVLPLLALGGLASLLPDVRPVMIIAALLLLGLALYGGARSAQWTSRPSSLQPAPDEPDGGPPPPASHVPSPSVPSEGFTRS